MYKTTKTQVVGLILVLSLGLVGCAEYLPFSSGGLDGTPTPTPASFLEVGQAEIVQLETNPAEPYSVNLWVIGEATHLYVFSGDSKTTWVQNIERDPNVRLQIGANVYELQAAQVTDAEEFETFAQAWDAKYGHRPRNDNVDETWLMRLTSRADG